MPVLKAAIVKSLYYEFNQKILLVKRMGLSWLFLRLIFWFQNRFRLLSFFCPVKPWSEILDFQESDFSQSFAIYNIREMMERIEKKELERTFDCLSVSDHADENLSGVFFLFFKHLKRIEPNEDWARNFIDGEINDSVNHWSDINEFLLSDIKGVWELSRFSWAYILGRAYVRKMDERYAEGFWKLFESWLEQNPPNRGCNWKCGQEASFRLFATAFARSVFSNAKATTPERLLKWRKFVTFTAERIFCNISYALSQRNNHGISECVGLITAVRIIPSMPDAEKYAKYAKEMLSRQLDELVYSDGGFSQHSTVYHRVLMNDLTWLIAVEKLAKERVDKRVIAAAERSLKFMISITDLATGQAPLHGANDGSDILPLTSCDYLDFRPCIIALATVLGFELDMPPGAYDEIKYWFKFSDKPLKKLSPKKLSFFSGESGYNFIHSKNSRLFCFAPEKYRHRPLQADLLHVDLWWKGLPITRDPGTYSYNSHGKFSSMFTSTRVHNTVTVDEKDQMERVSRFLFLPWPRTRVGWNAGTSTFCASHDGYLNLGLIHKRTINLISDDSWMVEDELQNLSQGKTSHNFLLNWLIADFNYTFVEKKSEMILHTPKGDFLIKLGCENASYTLNVVRGDESSDRGWWSPYYYYAEPALSLQLVVNSTQSVKICTLLKPLS